MSSWLQSLQMHEILIYGLVLGLPTLVIGFALIETTILALIRHRERLIMDERGLDLDHYPEQPEVEDCPSLRPGDMQETQAYAPRRG